MTAASRGQRVAGRVAAPSAVLAAAMAAVATVAVLDPYEDGHYPTCPVLAVTGLYCPGCGTLRAIHSLTEGDPATALDMNPLALLLLPALAAFWAGWAWRCVRGRPRGAPLPAWPASALLIALVVFTVARNVAVTAWLAPG
jgi:hypothetical protein